MKIVFLYPLNRDALDFLHENLPNDIEIIARIRNEDYSGTPPNQDSEIIKHCKDAEILMGPYVTDEILSKNVGKLKLVLIPWAGVERVDFELIKKYNVPIANSHGNARTVAEHAITLMLTASKNIIHHDQLLRKGDWSSRFKKKHSIIIQGKTVGLLGFGSIGTEIAKLLQGFDVKIIACRNSPEKTTKEQALLIEKVYSNNNLHTFLKQSDIVINSLPLTEDTKSLLAENEFEAMKENVVIVNVGRGPTIDEDAFFKYLKNGKIFVAGLDPQWHYPPRGEDKQPPHYPSVHPIHEFDNVVLSPHRAADTGHYERTHWDDVVENILHVYKGKKPFNLIDPELEY
ncbi:MAG: 2-hydroxyacid dehydrogenase [Asgard group archaeon]|nr:2-hydroxyacid dehydrogenase [Asgard group archaeon]